MTPDMGKFILVVMVCAACTFFERLLPFLVFGKKEVPSIVRYLGKILPMAIMATLVVYCIRDVSFNTAASFLPQLLAVAIVVVLHLFKKNTLLSIAGGTISYMILVQVIFPK